MYTIQILIMFIVSFACIRLSQRRHVLRDYAHHFPCHTCTELIWRFQRHARTLDSQRRRRSQHDDVEGSCLLHERGLGWRCVFCGKLSTLKRSLKLHIMSQHFGVHHDCICGRKFTWTKLLREHQKTCSSFQRYKRRRETRNK